MSKFYGRMSKLIFCISSILATAEHFQMAIWAAASAILFQLWQNEEK